MSVCGFVFYALLHHSSVKHWGVDYNTPGMVSAEFFFYYFEGEAPWAPP